MNIDLFARNGNTKRLNVALPGDISSTNFLN